MIADGFSHKDLNYTPQNESIYNFMNKLLTPHYFPPSHTRHQCKLTIPSYIITIYIAMLFVILFSMNAVDSL